MRPVRLLAALAVLLALVAAPAGAAAVRGPVRHRAAHPAAYRSTGRLAVRFAPGVSLAARRAALDRLAARGHAVRVARWLPRLDAAVLSGDTGPAARALLRRDRAVSYVEPESAYRPFAAEPSTPERVETGLDTALAGGNDGAGTEIAVLDSRVDATNDDLSAPGKVFYAGDFSTAFAVDPNDPDPPADLACDPAHCPHGTAVAAVAAATAGDGGMVGAAPAAAIRSYNVFRRLVYSDGYEEVVAGSGDIADAIADLAAYGSTHPALVALNLSLGGPFDNRLTRDALALLRAQAPQVTVTVAAGNDGGERASFPAGDPGVVSVGATGQGTHCPATTTTWSVTGFSSRGDVDVVAPGHCVTAWYPPEDPDTNAVTGPAVLDQVDGTSFAAPLVAGVVALLGQQGVHGDAARATILAGATHPSTLAVSEGTGRVRAPAALSVGTGSGPYTATFLDRGGQLANIVGRRTVEVLRVAPGAVSAPAAATLSVPYGTLTGVASAAEGTTITRTTATYAPPPVNKGSLTYALSASGGSGGIDTATVPLHLLDAADGFEGQPIGPGEAYQVPLVWGSRSAYVRSVYIPSSSHPVDLDLRYDPHAFDAEVFVWEPATSGGTADATGEPTSSVAYQSVGNGTRRIFGPDCEYVGPGWRPCRAGRWLMGWLTFSTDDSSVGTSRYGFGVRYGWGPILSPPAVPERTWTGTAHLPFPVSWKGLHVPTFDVQYATRSKVGSTWVMGAWQPWLTATTTHSGTFGSGDVPVAVVAGRTYYFRFVGHDAYGNVSKTATATASVPLDDSALSYSAGWGSAAASGRWDAAVHYATTANRGATVLADTSRFVLVGDRCSACGEVKVYVDGHYLATVSTHAGGTYARQALWTSAVLPGGVKPHRLTLVSVGTAGHPKVVVDAVGLLR